MKLFTWLDVRRLIRQETFYGSQLPEGINAINCFSDALEISLSNASYQSLAESTLQGWFGEWYQNERQIIQLDLGDSVLSVEFSSEELDTNSPINVRPFWQEIAYINDDQAEGISAADNLHLPKPYTISPSLIAFYSFKGGVGRTLHLAAHLFALLEYAKEIEKSITVLVIDADLEAPGLTYWNRIEKQQSAVSFINFLEAYHYSPLPIEQTLELFAKEIKKSPKNEGKSTFYFLPACLKDEQLLDTPVLPEHLARSPGDGWTFGDAIHQLGKALKVDYVLVDLRAGLSEISSPLIFDPRIQRFLVTTATKQSVAGSSLVLEQISRVAPSEEDIDNSKYFDPSIIISFLTPELKALPAFDNALFEFRTAYTPATSSEDSNIYSKRLEIKETDFSQELLYINNWDEARLKIAPTSIAKVAKEWAISQLQDSIDLTELQSDSSDLSKSLDEVRKFRDICRQYEFAESGTGEKILVTEALKNLATSFQAELPRIVSIGAKGSGKTFIYVQLSRLKSWEKFLQIALPEKPELKAHIFPFLQSKNLQENANSFIKQAREEVKIALGDSTDKFFHSDYEERIKRSLEQELTELEWTGFWINEVARSLGLISEESSSFSLQQINSYLKDKSIRIIYLFDGLEDIFQEAASDEKQKLALRSLINLPNKLSEIRQANLGLIILLRRDFLRHSITQNADQFESLYSSYDLSWNADSFLKLTYWICIQAKVIGATEDKIEKLGREDFVSELEKLWGEKLGGKKEARTASWVFAALTDFKGRLQARDIVRLLFNAANLTVEKSEELKFKRWSDRILPPQAVRQSLEPCSDKKVGEAKEEYPKFKLWVDSIESYTQEQKQIPFVAKDLGLDQTTIQMLEDMGVIYQDRENDLSRYYMPEIFRAGLKFKLQNRAKPRVLVLKRKALGRSML